MSLYDWLVLLLFFAYMIWDGSKSHKKNNDLEGMLLAKRSMPGWALGLSIMATQASAITFIGTTGQAFFYDMRFIQVYLGLPIAMIVLSLTLIPLYRRVKPFTAYETLEKRFGLKVRLATSSIFLLSRGISLGLSIAAPAYLLAWILQLSLGWTILIIGFSTTVYTLFGGLDGVIRTDVKQMALLVFGLIFCFAWIITHLPEEISLDKALHLSGASGKLKSLDFSFDPGSKYSIWSGILAGFFLMLSYFGTDQSQVQRYLSAASLKDARNSLMMSAGLKIPMQFFILLLGALLYCFYLFADRPLMFLPDRLHADQPSEVLTPRDAEFQRIHAARKEAALAFASDPSQPETRKAFIKLDKKANKLREMEMRQSAEKDHNLRNDLNYVMPYFILHELPPGIIGLIIAAILAAALSSIDSALNALATVSVIDWYRRLRKKEKSDQYDLKLTRWLTAFWGAIATTFAFLFGETESIIELVNQMGSYFYGPLLGVFVLLWVKPVNGRGAFLGLFSGLLGVLMIAAIFKNQANGSLELIFPIGMIPYPYKPLVEYLWLNPIGVFITVGAAWLFSKKPLSTGESS